LASAETAGLSPAPLTLLTETIRAESAEPSRFPIVSRNRRSHFVSINAESTFGICKRKVLPDSKGTFSRRAKNGRLVPAPEVPTVAVPAFRDTGRRNGRTIIRLALASALRTIARANCRVGTIRRAYSKIVKRGPRDLPEAQTFDGAS
jgi:hypothetical protein